MEKTKLWMPELKLQFKMDSNSTYLSGLGLLGVGGSNIWHDSPSGQFVKPGTSKQPYMHLLSLKFQIIL